jgi:Flp pilus assembly protein TadD
VLRPAVNRGHASEELVYGELFDRAYELLEAGDAEAAIEPLERAVELRPEDPAAWNNLAIAYARVGRDDDAHAAFRRRGELDPQSERSRSYRAWSLSQAGHEALMAGDLARAVELFESSLEADPAAPDVWALLAGAHEDAGHADQARAAREQERALRAAPPPRDDAP